MRTFLSSIFSSRTLDLSDRRGTGSTKAFALALCLVGGAEGLAWTALSPIGDYWQYWTPAAAAKFETYRAGVRLGSVPRLVVVGDSTGARDIDPAVLSEPGSGASAFNLSWPANFPLAFKACTLPLFRGSVAPELVVASFSPTGFFENARVSRFEESIIESPYCRRLRGERSASDFSHLARARDALPFFRSWWSGAGLPRVARLGFMPLSGADQDPDVADEASTFAPARFAAVEELFRMAGASGFRVVVVIPPRIHPSPSRLLAEQLYVERLANGRLAHLDYRDAPFLTEEYFYDGGHLNGAGAELFSRRLARDLQRLQLQATDTVARGM